MSKERQKILYNKWMKEGREDDAKALLKGKTKEEIDFILEKEKSKKSS